MRLDYWASKPITGLSGEDRPGTLVLDAAPQQARRPRQRDCRYEPPYPGEETVVMAMADPSLVAHGFTGRCFTAGPHSIAECAEFISNNVDDYVEEHRWERRP